MKDASKWVLSSLGDDPEDMTDDEKGYAATMVKAIQKDAREDLLAALRELVRLRDVMDHGPAMVEAWVKAWATAHALVAEPPAA